MNEVTDVQEIKSRLKELTDLLAMRQAAADTYSAAIKDTALKACCSKSALRKLVKAASDGGAQATKEESEEIVSLIESCLE